MHCVDHQSREIDNEKLLTFCLNTRKFFSLKLNLYFKKKTSNFKKFLYEKKENKLNKLNLIISKISKYGSN